MARAMEISTPLGSDVLLFHSMQGREELSSLSEYHVGLLSAKSDINPDEILGRSVTVRVALPDDSPRYFNGYVTRFTQQGTLGRYHRYAAVLRPWTWFMTRTADCRIFQEMTVPDIVKKVFGDHSTADFKVELTGSYRKWNYCVQYRETDFNFISRLLEHEGIYYYFKHTASKHTMVLTDGGHGTFPGYAKIPFIAPDRQVRADIEHISSWECSREVQSGVYVHDDYDFERPSVSLRTQKALPRNYSPSNYEIYDYPGEYLQKADGEHYATARIHELGSQFEISHMETVARGVGAGYLFTLEGCPRADQNRENLIISATYDLEFSDYESMPEAGRMSYRCAFGAMSTKQQYRPRRATAKPFVQGPQTALVVGPAGEEIYTDKYGRVKVQFVWDRLGKKDANSSCWVRVSSPWAGKQWGGISIPRIGQEVIVDFLEGDPDQPIIIGRVYNAEQMPPYALPTNMTQSGMKSRSSKGGGPDNFNELRFEDKKGSEQVFLHAEKNQDIEVENDETHWVGHDRKKTIDNDETTHVKHDRTETVDNNETITIHGNRTETVDKNESITISGSRTEGVAKDESISIEKNRTENVGENETVDIGGKRTLSVGKAESISVADSRTDKVEKDEETTIGQNRKAKVGKDDALQVGKKLLVDVGDEITIKTGSASITMKKDGTITVKGKDITLDGSGKINIKASGDVIVKGSKITQN